jgi:acyl-CoA thioesterase-1
MLWNMATHGKPSGKLKNSSGNANKRRPGESKFTQWMPAAGIAILGIVTVSLVLIAVNRPVEPSVARDIPSIMDEPEPTITAEPLATVSVTRTADALPVLFIGDSLTGNLFASTEDAGFRPTMIRAMEANGPVAETQGFRVGASTAEVSGITDIGTDQALAIVELGTNNVGSNTPIADFTTDYSALLDRIRETSPNAALVCAGVWQAPGVGDPYDAVIKAECEARGGAFRKLSDLHIDQANRGPAGKTDVFGGDEVGESVSDNFHPNDVGYSAIANRLLEAVSFN